MSSISSQQVVTPVGIFSYANIWKARAHPDSPTNLKYSITLVFDKSADLAPLQAAYDEVLQAAYEGGMPYGARPGGLLDGAVRYPGDEFYKDKMLLSMSQDEDRFDHKNVVGANNQPIMDKSQIYSGAKGHALVTFYSYKGGTGGIGCSLHGLMKVADGEALGGAAVDAQAGFAKAGIGGGSSPKPPTSPPTAPAAPVVPPTAPAAHVMTPKANGSSYDEFIKLGWTHEQLIEGGYISS